MPVYDQLLLEYGGGVISAQAQSDAYKKDACVAIGIGGTGIAALKQLKKEVFQRLKPDNEEDPVPRYGHIKFIAIDSDEISAGQGKGKLLGSEMFLIKNQNLAGVLGTENGKETVKKDHTMDWMDIDNISALNTPEGAGGIRQVGRYLLISKAGQLKQKIYQECTAAMQAIRSNSVTVYIFAGISGGTGSGCFIDTCYIVRKLMEENGWAAASKIMGFFFLPDVATSKPEVMKEPKTVKYNQRNGYAAMKELDYLMNLQTADDHFYQKYGSFTIDTQVPPVDMCHLISATKADGRLQPDGFAYCISVAADYVMSYLVDVSNAPADGKDLEGITLRGHLANVQTGVGGLLQEHGAPRIYHVVGASNAEIPMTQISTYLAAGFMRRFGAAVGREATAGRVSKQQVDEWAARLGITPTGVMSKVTRRTDQLMLPEVDKDVLAQLGTMPRGKVPEPWGGPGNDFLDRNEGKRTANSAALKKELEDYNLETIQRREDTASLILNTFKELHTLCTNPAAGPYFAANMIHNGGYDLTSVIDGIIKTYKEQRNTQELQLEGRGVGGILDDIVNVSADYVSSNFMNRNRRYGAYKGLIEDYYICSNRIREYDAAISVMQTFSLQVKKLYQVYFAPLIEMLDNVRASFDEDMAYFQTPAARRSTAYTRQILKLSDVQESLDASIKALQPHTLVSEFVDSVMDNHEEWINRDSDRITAFISRYMSSAFREQMNRSLQDYLYIKYPHAAGPQQLAEEVERDIITEQFNNAAAMFWCNPNFDMVDSTYKTSQLSVPVSTTCVCAAADNFQDHAQDTCIVRKTGFKDRIFIMRFFSGAPFYAYNGVSLLKDEYAASQQAGTHLYAKTGRGDDGSGDKDWRYFLPTPTPFSVDPGMTENADVKLRSYNEALREGIIAPDPAAPNRWLIRKAHEIEERRYVLDDFMTVDTAGRKILDELRLNAEKERVKDLLDHAWDIDRAERTLLMKNDGAVSLGNDVVERVRRDYYMAFPKQQELVGVELKKRESLHRQLEELDALEADYYEYKAAIEEFCGAVMYGIFTSEDRAGKSSYTRIAKMLYPYKKGGVPTELELTGPEREFVYGAQYPLYQAFLTYNNLDRDEMPRAEILKKYEGRKNNRLQAGDNIIGRTLELAWDGQALRDLSKNVAIQIGGQDILRFYLNLVEQIQIFKNQFEYEDWVRIEKKDNHTVTDKGETARPEMNVIYVSDGLETMTVHLNQSRAYAWSASKKDWVRLSSQMYVYKTDRWTQIRLDDQNNIII